MKRKLKLQMNLSIDGFVAGPNGELDWMNWDTDEGLSKDINYIIDTSDTILLGRKMTDGFVNYWENVVKNQPESPEYAFAKKMVDTPKIVFTKTLEKSDWHNTKLATGKLSEEIKQLKSQKGKDLLVYGGADFVSSLIKEGLIDEFHFGINPAIIGRGLSIFQAIDKTQKLELVSAKAFKSGTALLVYRTINNRSDENT